MLVYCNHETEFHPQTTITVRLAQPREQKTYKKGVRRDFFEKIELKVWNDSLNSEGFRKVSKMRIGISTSDFNTEEKELYRKLLRYKAITVMIK